MVEFVHSDDSLIQNCIITLGKNEANVLYLRANRALFLGTVGSLGEHSGPLGEHSEEYVLYDCLNGSFLVNCALVPRYLLNR